MNSCYATAVLCAAGQVGESYERAYTDMVRVQQLTELEEVVEYKAALEGKVPPALAAARTSFIKQLWQDRLRGAQRHVEVRPTRHFGRTG